MTKDAYYFSHDANARQDPKILEMMSVYGAEGYGWYWIIVEMMREQSGFKLNMQGKYTFNALAMQMHCKPDASKQFVHDCINEFKLFDSDGESFWSNSLLRRMAIREEISQKRREAAQARWGKNTDTPTNFDNSNANRMQMHSKDDANGMQGKERKGNRKESIIPFSEIVSFLNQKTGKKFKHTTNKTQTSIEARWNEGFVVDDFKKVINAKVSDWKHDEKMSKYLRPETLFGTKFEGYLNESVSSEDAKESDPDIALLEKKRELEMSIELGEEYWRKFESIEEYENIKRELRELEQQL